MDKSWLQDYGANEEEAYQRFLKSLVAEKLGPNDIYPRRDRFVKLQNPVSTAHHEHIWAQLPFYGSSIVPLMCRPREDDFLKLYGFDSIRDLDRLVDLAKATGRVQFILSSNAVNYAGLDYLDTIFKELKPPAVFPLPVEYNSPKKERYNFMAEFLTIANIKFLPAANAYWQSQSLPPGVITELEARLCRIYLKLRVFGYNDLAEKLLNLIMDDPVGDAIGLANLLSDLITAPMDNLLLLTYKPIQSKSKEYLVSDLNIMSKHGVQSSTSKAANMTMPYDIGKLLMGKLTYLPEGYDACLAVMDKYRQSDLSKLLDAVHQGCIQNNADIVIEKGKELETVFDNLWKDSKRGNIAEGIHYGVMAEVGVVGALATAPIAGIGGILAMLGFEVADKKLELSEQAARLKQSSHMVVISDFKKKYSIS